MLKILVDVVSLGYNKVCSQTLSQKHLPNK